MFEDVFTEFYEKNKEIKAIGVWGKDGLDLDKKYFANVEDIDVDLELSGAELADIIGRLENTKISPQTFFIKIYLRQYLLIVTSLTPDFFLVILAAPDIIEGKLRFYVDLYKDRLTSAL